MSKWNECVHNVPMETPCNRCPREGRLVLTMNLLTGYLSRWIVPHRKTQEALKARDEEQRAR